MRRWTGLWLGMGIVIAGGVALAAAAGGGGGDVDRQTFRWTGTDASTSSTEWATIGELTARTGCPDDPSTTAAVSVELAADSAPVDVRVVMDDPLSVCRDCPEPEGIMRPRAVRFEGPSSFTFVARRAVGGHGTVFEVQWRLAASAPPGATAALDSATLNLVWDDLDALCA